MPAGQCATPLPLCCIASPARVQALLGVLDSVTQRERDAAQPPPLPAPPADMAADFTRRTQWRVQRVWDVMHMPALQRLEMLVQFAEWGFAERVEGVLDAWEAAAAAVSTREAALAALDAVRRPGPRPPCLYPDWLPMR